MTVNENFTTTLCDLQPGNVASIEKVVGDMSHVRRIMALGFNPGAEVKMVRKAPLGDPLEFEVSGCLLTLRSQEAMGIIVRIQDK